jgi:hypothetical protein
MKFVKKQAILLSLTLLWFSGSMWAQGLASLRGTVADSSGAVVPMATVSLTQVATGLSRTVETNGQGDYLIPSLDPAGYVLTVQGKGFQKFTQAGITLLADQSATINVRMEVGQATETVNVVAAATQVDTTTGTQKQVIDHAQIVELPLNGRNAAALTMLVAGASPPPSGGGGSIQGLTKQFPSEIAVSTNGAQEDQVSYQLDGASYMDGFFSTNLPFPLPDALQEFSVQTSNYEAQYGNNSGGVVNIVTKSGTNSVHGDVFEFDRNAVFNARNFFAATRDQLKRNQFGFVLGGPVVIPKVYDGRDRTFWFFGYQGTLIRNIGGTSSALLPTPAELNGDFSTYLDASNPSNPLGKAVNIIDPQTGQPFPGNQIPKTRLDPAALAVENYLPHPAGTGLIYYQAPIIQNEYETVERFDHSFSSADRLTVRTTWNDFSNHYVWNPQNLVVLSGGSEITAQDYLLHETHIFRPNLLNEFRFTYWRLKSSRGPAPQSPNMADFGVTNIVQSVPKAIQSISVSGFFSIAENPLAAFPRQGFTWADDVSWVRGSHDFRFGFSANWSRVEQVNNYGEDGFYTFTSDATNLAPASFLLGTMRTFTQDWNDVPQDGRDLFLGFYAQDSYRVSKRLTINYGLRYEPGIPWAIIRGRTNYFTPTNYYANVSSQLFTNAPRGLLFEGDPGFPPGTTRGLTNNWTNLMPRFGFAWDVSGNGRTSIRGGGGVFYDTRLGGDQLNSGAGGAAAPYNPGITITSPQGPFSNPYLGITNPFPSPFPPPSNFIFPAPLAVGTEDGSQRNMVSPVEYNWNLTVEHEPASGWLLRAAYVGSHGTHIRDYVDLNPAVYIPGSTLSTDQRRPFAGYSDITMPDYDANSEYNALQLTLQKRRIQSGLLHDATVVANYTYSKSIDTVPVGSGVEGVTPSTIPYWMSGRHQMDRGVSEFNHTHNMVLSYDWPLPGLSNLNRFTRALLGHWELTGILTAQSGFPFTVTAGKDQSQTGLGQDRGVIVGPAKGSGACGTRAPCVDFLYRNSFVLPAIGTFGNIGKNTLTGPNLIGWDMGIFKNFPFGERYKVQFRAEFFNIFNRVNFSNPTGNLSSGSFGTITSAGDPRIGQLALKVFF